MPGGLGPRFALEAGFLIALAAVAAYARLSAAEIIAVMAGGWLLTALFEAIAATRERVYARTRWERRVEEEPPAVKPEQPPAVEPEPKRRRSWIRRAAEPEAEGKAAPEAPPPVTAAAAEEAPAKPPGAAAPAARVRAPAEALARPAAPIEGPAPGEAPAAARPAAEAEVRPEVPARASTAAAEPVRRVEADAPARPRPPADDEATGEFERPPQGPRRWLRRRQAEPPPAPEVLLEPERPSARHVRLIRGSRKAGPEEATPSAEGDDQERKGADTAP